MKVIGVIPARYKSTRLYGKPLSDICGKPMIWWVYKQVTQVPELHDVIIATDDERIAEVCDSYKMKYVMTSDSCPEHITRIHEVSEKVEADFYVCVNGDEPLIKPEIISKIIPKQAADNFYFGGAMRILTDPAETIDCANIKVVATDDGRCIYMSRTPVPYPRGTLLFQYNKYVGIECFNKSSLDFFVSVPMGSIERIEDIDHLRFIENGKPMIFTYVDSDSISVDTPMDLQKVREIIIKRMGK